MSILKEQTSELHRKAEQQPFSQRMVNGELTQEEYLKYLKASYYIFNEIERRGVLPNSALERRSRILEDINELGGKLDGNYYSNSYVNHLSQISDEELLPHVYLNYLAVMFGGQMIKPNIPGNGKMYDFDDMRNGMSSIRDIQSDEWVNEVNRGYTFWIEIYQNLENDQR